VFGLLDRIRKTNRAYAAHEHRPLEGYLRTMGTYGLAGLTLTGVAMATRRRIPERISAGDVALVSLATHKLSRILAKEAVTSPLRAPFTSYVGPAGAAELTEEVRDDQGPVMHAVGELLSCPFCLAVWIASGLSAGLVLAPRFTRLVGVTFTAVAASDFLQLAYTAAKNLAEKEPPAHTPGSEQTASRPATA